ncbi:MAG: ISAzo13 family transposase [Planctomycetes bacterium]|nr:ISAzo13 family transposase [Planctomycetota bacterium]
MRNVYDCLSEKDRRRYAAAEVVKLGYGGVAYIARLFGCSPESIKHGVRELDQLPDDPLGNRIRRPGAGRPKIEEQYPEVVQHVQQIIGHRTAGDPMREDVTWTDLTPNEIAGHLREESETIIAPRIVRRILGGLNFGLRKIAKVLPGKESPDRDRQFLRIAELKDAFLAAGNPVISMDTKKKEFLGRLYRAGRVYTQQAIRAFDHDFPSWAEGVIIPHGFYDVARNEGYLHLGLSRDTSQFACDSLRLYLEQDGLRLYPAADELLLLCDGGGSNGSRTHIFKQDLQRLVNDLGITIRVAHYPAYCSKFNPIERRLFCHVTRACRGVLFDTLATVRSLMEKTSTQTGLSVTVRVIETIYETGRKAAEEFKRNMPILFDDLLPKWNYRVVPQVS